MSNEAQVVTVPTKNDGIESIAQARGILCYGVQHRLNIRRRACDYTQHLTRRRLLFQRFGELAVAILYFLPQANILNSDYC
jgi:hypothetical protein